MTIMVITCLTIIFYISCKVCSDQLFYITAAATYHLNPLCLKDIFCSLAHIASQHDHYSHLSEHRSYPALASAALR